MYLNNKSIEMTEQLNSLESIFKIHDTLSILIFHNANF